MRKWRLIAPLLVGLVMYGCAWWFSYRLSIRTTMANARYFYFGSSPGGPGDKIGYVAFWPIYKTRYIIQSIQDEGHDDVHWSDRKDPVLPTDAEVAQMETGWSSNQTAQGAARTFADPGR
jgi:hypothetical protein